MRRDTNVRAAGGQGPAARGFSAWSERCSTEPHAARGIFHESRLPAAARRFAVVLSGVSALVLAACSAEGVSGIGSSAPPVSSTGQGPTGSTAPGASSNVGTGGGQDFAAFRLALNQGRIPGPDTLDPAGFFAEHYTSLPPPTCGKAICLHGLLSVSPDDLHGGNWTLLQMGMSSPIDPATVGKPPLDLAVVLNRSGSMADAGKMEYAKTGLKLLIAGLGDADTLSLVVFDSTAQKLFGPARVTDKAALTAIVDRIEPGSSTNIFDGLKMGYDAALSTGDETQIGESSF